jgi:hypothetical protein
MKHKTTSSGHISKGLTEKNYFTRSSIPNILTVGSIIFIGVPSLGIPFVGILFGTNGLWGFLICLMLIISSVFLLTFIGIALWLWSKHTSTD